MKNKKAMLFFACFSMLVCLVCLCMLFGGYEPGDGDTANDTKKEKIHKAMDAGGEQKIRETSLLKSHTPVSGNALPLLKTKVYLDAGHGGNDPGITTWVSSYKDENEKTVLTEKELAFYAAKEVAKKLKESGIEVVFVRDKDVPLSREERLEMVEEENVLLLSFHVNESQDSTLHGMEILLNDTAERFVSKEQQEAFAKCLTEATMEPVNPVSDAEKTQAYWSGENRLCIQINMGYLSNAQERRLLEKQNYRERFAKGVSDGILLLLEK